MLKTIHTLTIRDYSFFEKTGDVKYLQEKPYSKNVDIESLLIEIYKNLTGKNEQTEQEQKEIHKIRSVYRIQKLICLYEATANLFNLYDINKWKKAIGKQETKTKNIEFYIDEIEKNTSIRVKKKEDLKKLQKEIERWTDKFRENFKDDEKKEGLTFMQIVLGVFAAMNMKLDYDMYLSDFFILKEQLNQKK